MCLGRCSSSWSIAMKCSRRKFLNLTTGAAVLPIASRVAGGETYPSRPITMMVGFPPGGPTDTLARILSEAMQRSLGQTVVVETVSGASGTIATGRVTHGSPDGYTIVIGNWASNVGATAIYPLNFDVLKDLQPISLLAASSLWILGKNALPPKTATELIAWLGSNPNLVTFGTVGTGSAAHLCGVYLQRKTGAHFQYVPYRGAGQVVPDLIGGQIDLTCLEASATLGKCGGWQIQSVCRNERKALVKIAEHANDDRIGRAGTQHLLLARPVDDKGGTQLRRRSVGGRRQGCLGRPGRAAASRNARPSHISARSAEPRSTRGVPNGGDRQMVADHQSSKHQGRINAWVNVRFGSRVDGALARTF